MVFAQLVGFGVDSQDPLETSPSEFGADGAVAVDLSEQLDGVVDANLGGQGADWVLVAGQEAGDLGGVRELE